MSCNEKPVPQSHILIIDDCEDNLLLMRLLLESQDYRVTTANHPQKGLKQITRSLPNMIILDLMMPCMSGLEVIKHLKTSAIVSKIPVLLLTANKELKKSDAECASAVFYKPFDLESLLKLIRSMLSATEIGKQQIAG